MKNFKSIKISKPAEIDLKDIADYTLKQWGKLQKKTYLDLFKQSFITLSHNNADDTVVPLGRAREEIDAGLLSYHIERHVIYFRETEDCFIIVRILHSRMDPEKHLSETELAY